MAGLVMAHAMFGSGGGAVVSPDVCPVKPDAYLHVPDCYRRYPDGARRSCIHWRALTPFSVSNVRIDIGELEVKALEAGSDTGRCSVICAVARRNRPPGA